MKEDIIHKAGSAYSVADNEAVFIASTETPDRHGDIVRQNWVTTGFKRNPVFLFEHDSRQLPIGKVKKWWTEGAKSFAHVVAMPAGIDDLADKAWRMLKEGFLNAVSVGFSPIDDPIPLRDKNGYFIGYEYPKSELLELSLVSVPANRDAIAVAKNLHWTERDIANVFEQPEGVSAEVKAERRRLEFERLRAS